jgi:hypothetical protein
MESLELSSLPLSLSSLFTEESVLSSGMNAFLLVASVVFGAQVIELAWEVPVVVWQG